MERMQFEPLGGYPPIVRTEESTISERAMETQGFATTKIVNIADIMQSKKKEDLYMAFGTEEETESRK